MLIPARIKRFWLRVWYAEISGPDTLLTVLAEKATLLAAQMGTGAAIIRTSGNGKLVEFSAAGAMNIGPQGMAELIEDLMSRYETASAELIAEGIPTPTQAQINARMMGTITRAVEVRNSYINLITGNTGTFA